MSDEEENLLSKATLYHASNVSPLSLHEVIELAKAIVQIQRKVADDEIALSRGCLDGFLKRNDDLKVVEMQCIESCRT